MEQSVAADKTHPPEGTEDLLQGDDEFEIHFEFVATQESIYEGTNYTARLPFAWDDIFAAVAPRMINECSEPDLQRAFRAFFEQRAKESFHDDKELKGQKLLGFAFRDVEIETCLVQFRALGLIVQSVRSRSVKDTSTYWALTPYGDYLMTQLRALRRTPASRPAAKGHVEPE